MADNYNDFDAFFADIRDVGTVSDILVNLTGIQPTEYEFLGFDIARLLGKFWRLSDRSSQQTVMTSIFEMVSIGLMRGNIRADQLSKTADAGKKKIQELVDRYEIPMKKNPSDTIKLSPDTITFVRMINIFPLHASLLIHQHDSLKNRVTVNNDYGSKFCPVELRHGGAAALVPQSAAGSFYLLVHIAYMMELGKKIDNRNLSINERFENQQRYALIGQKSDTINQVQRVAVFKALGLDRIEVFESVIEGANYICDQLEDPRLDRKGIKILKDRVIITENDDIEKESEKEAKNMKKNILQKPDEEEEFKEKKKTTVSASSSKSRVRV